MHKGSLLERTLRRKRELFMRKQTIIWGFINLIIFAVLWYNEILSKLLMETFEMPTEWIRYLEYVLMFIFGSNSLLNYLMYTKLSLLYTSVDLTPRQQSLLAVNSANSGFSVKSTSTYIPRDSNKDRSTSLKTNLLSEPFSLSSDYHRSFNTSPSTSWQYYRNFQTPEAYSLQTSPTRQYDYPDSIEYNKIRLRTSLNSSSNDLEENTITDEATLMKYLTDHNQKSEMNTFETCKPQRSISSSFWNFGHNLFDYSSQLRKYSYQLATRLPQTSTSQTDCDPDFPTHYSGDEIWFRLGISSQDLNTWTKNLREWITLTILNRLVAEIDSINDTLQIMGSCDLQVGGVSLTTLRQVCLTKSQSIPSLSALIPYLELSSNQEYLVQRIKELGKGGCMSEFIWNEGGYFKGRPWVDHLPTDSAIVIHLFCTYLDSRLPPHPNYPDGKTFTNQFFVRSPDKPVLSKDSLYIYQTRLVPPHFKIIIGDKVWDITKGRNNLFHSILLFLFHTKMKENGMFGLVNLGLSGVNILWVLESN